jgi:hypothetical protein
MVADSAILGRFLFVQYLGTGQVHTPRSQRRGLRASLGTGHPGGHLLAKRAEPSGIQVVQKMPDVHRCLLWGRRVKE